MRAADSFAIAFLIALSPIAALASETDGTITTGSRGWGENIAWINFAPEPGEEYRGLRITDDRIEGYGWSAVAGWLNFSPSDETYVTNTAEGDIGGYAWSSAYGWISMDGAEIDSSGIFRGTAGSEDSLVGRISFDCDYCSVSTDWRPASIREESDAEEPLPIVRVSDPGGSGSASYLVNAALPPSLVPLSSPPPYTPAAGGEVQKIPFEPITNANQDHIAAFYEKIGKLVPGRSDPTHVESYNAKLLIRPTQSGLVVGNFPGGIGIVVEIPLGALSDEITVSVGAYPVESGVYGMNTFFVAGVMFEVIATDSKGNPVHAFAKHLKITLLVPEELGGRANLGAYWLDEGAKNWIGIPETVFSGTTASFFVDHLTRFALLESRVPVPDRTRSPMPGGILGASLVVLFLTSLWYRRRHRRQ